MALIDDNLMLCSAVALNTGAAGTYLIGSQIDSNTVRDLGNGRPVYFFIDVETAIEAAGAGTISFVLASDDAVGVGTTATTSNWHYQTPPIPTSTTTDTTTLIAGTRLFECAIPSDGITPYGLFLGLLQITASNAITAGKVNVGFTLSPTSQRYYPNGI